MLVAVYLDIVFHINISKILNFLILLKYCPSLSKELSISGVIKLRRLCACGLLICYVEEWYDSGVATIEATEAAASVKKCSTI